MLNNLLLCFTCREQRKLKLNIRVQKRQATQAICPHRLLRTTLILKAHGKMQ